MLDVSEQTIRIYLKEGTLKGVQSKKKRWRIQGRELIRFLQGKS